MQKDNSNAIPNDHWARLIMMGGEGASAIASEA